MSEQMDFERFSDNMTTKEILTKAGLRAERVYRMDGKFRGMRVVNRYGEQMHNEPCCSASGAIKIATKFMKKDVTKCAKKN